MAGNASVAARSPSEIFQMRMMAFLPIAAGFGRTIVQRRRMRNPPKCLFPGEHRLLQFGDAGVAAGQHLAKLVDQRRGGSVDEAGPMAEADDAPLAFRNGREI